MSEAQQEVVPQEPQRVQVVTNENFDQYVNEKLGVNPDPEQVGQEAHQQLEAEQAEKKAEEAEKVEDEKSDKADKKKGRLNERFSELTAEKKAAIEKAAKLEAEAKMAREEAEKARREALELRQKYEPPKTDELGPKPIPSQFNDTDEFAKALEDWTTEKAQRDLMAKAEAERKEAEAKALQKSWLERQSVFKAEASDYEEVISGSDVRVSEQVRDAIIESEVGPQILYHLAKNPEVASKLGDMTVGRALRELGKLEAALTKEVTKTEAKTTVAEISKAPAPISPLRGANAPAAGVMTGSQEFVGTYEEYKARRLAGKIR